MDHLFFVYPFHIKAPFNPILPDFDVDSALSSRSAAQSGLAPNIAQTAAIFGPSRLFFGDAACDV
jgi:hypothetical protein